jgi:hypothetical protein
MDGKTPTATTEIVVSEEMQFQLARGGDGGVFCELIRPYRRKLYLQTLSMVGNDADAEEVVQNTLSKRSTIFLSFDRSIFLHFALQNNGKRGPDAVTE